MRASLCSNSGVSMRARRATAGGCPQRPAGVHACAARRARASASHKTEAPSVESATPRRSLLLGGASLALALSAPKIASAQPQEVAELAVAAAPPPQQAQEVVVDAAEVVSDTTATKYEDPTDKFEIVVPAGWARGEGTLSGARGFSGATGERRTIAFFPDDPEVKDVNISVVITNVSVEFTRLGSFGNIDTFATNLINSLDRSFLLRSRTPSSEPIQLAELVDYSSTGGRYNVEYTIEKIPTPKRHLFSSVVMGNNGRYNRLYTVTGQCLEQDLPKYKDELINTLNSFKANIPTAQ